MNLVPLPLPWLELSVVVAALGALCVSPVRDPIRAWRWGLLFTGAALACTLLACLGFYLAGAAGVDDGWSFRSALFGRQLLTLDELNAPLLPVVALLHFLTGQSSRESDRANLSPGAIEDLP